ncbi:ROK family protein [candidate division KSB1 bacterium]
MKYVAGVDLGGTKISAGIVSEELELLKNIITVPTESDSSKERILGNIENAVISAFEINEIAFDSLSGIGIGSPGPLNLKSGEILNPENVKPLNYFNIKKYFSDKFNIKVLVNYDSSCFVLGELFAGKARNMKNIIGLTLGTGTGCGIICNGVLYNGATGTSGEIWKTSYLDGNVEDYTSAKAVRKLFYKKTGKEIPAKRISELAEKKDHSALMTWKEYGRHLGMLVSGLINFFDPDAVILGGSLSRSYKFFKDDLIEVLKASINKGPLENLKILVSDLGEKGAVIGAAVLFNESIV